MTEEQQRLPRFTPPEPETLERYDAYLKRVVDALTTWAEAVAVELEQRQ
jgi:hypothetical protein